MTQVIPYIGVGTFLIGIVTFVLAVLILRSARRSIQMAEDRMQYLHEERERLAFYRQESRHLQEELEQERQERQEAQRKVDRLEREREKLWEARQESLQPGRERTTEVRPRYTLRNLFQRFFAEGGNGDLHGTDTGRGHEYRDDSDQGVSVEEPERETMGDRETREMPTNHQQEGTRKQEEGQREPVRVLRRTLQ